MFVSGVQHVNMQSIFMKSQKTANGKSNYFLKFFESNKILNNHQGN